MLGLGPDIHSNGLCPLHQESVASGSVGSRFICISLILQSHQTSSDYVLTTSCSEQDGCQKVFEQV